MHHYRVEAARCGRRRVILEPEGIELGGIESADVNVTADRLRLTLTIPEHFFDVIIETKEEPHDRA